MTSKSATGRRPLCAIAAVVLAALSVPAAPAWAAANRSIEIVVPGTTQLLSSGGSETLFSVLLPRGAHCLGDTANGGYREWSYLVPKGTDLSKISFQGLVPQPGLGFDAGGEFFGPVATVPGTGELRLPRAFSFDRWLPSDLFAAGATTSVWEGGVACSTVHGEMSTYWNTEFSFTTTRSDPTGFTWSVAQHGASDWGGRPWVKTVVAGTLIVGAAAFARALWPGRARQRRRGSTESNSSESQRKLHV